MTRHHDTKLKKLNHTLAQGVANQDRTFEKSAYTLPKKPAPWRLSY